MEITKSVKYENGTVSFRLLFNKKHPNATVFIRYKTNQKRLLYMYLHKFIIEKVSLAPNPNNYISDATCTTEGIVFRVPDIKIFSVIQQIHRYLWTASINTPQSNLAGKGKSSDLFNSTASFSVLIVGKCKSTEKALSGNNPKKIETFVRGMNAISYRQRNDFDMAHKYIPEEIELKLSPLEKMLFVSCYGSLPYLLKDDKLIALNPSVIPELKTRNIFRSTFQGKAKSFMISFGNIGSPSANDKDGKKHKEKCKLILASENMLAEIYSTLHGFNYKFDNVEELKSVDGKALTKIKTLKIF